MAKTRLYSKHGEEGLEWMLVSFHTHPSAFLHSGHQGREQEQCPARLRPVLGQALQSQGRQNAVHTMKTLEDKHYCRLHGDCWCLR